MVLPGWNSIDAVSKYDSAIRIVTLAFWGTLVVAEIIAHAWKNRSGLFNIIAFTAIALAVTGEVAQFKYDARKEVLREQYEARLRADYDDQLRKTNEQLAAIKKPDEKEQKQISDAVILASVVRSVSGYGGGGGADPIQLHRLINLMYDSPYQSVRDIARSSLGELAKEDEAAFTAILPANSLGYRCNQPNAKSTMETINAPKTNSVNLVPCFLDMKKLTGWNVATFDIYAANEGCKRHDCKLDTPMR